MGRSDSQVRRLVRALSTALALGAAAVAGGAERGPLDGERIRELIVGNTLVGPYYASLYQYTYTADGRIFGSTGRGTDAGRWRIRDGNVYCHQWVELYDAEERCYEWYDTGDGRLTMKNVDAFRQYDVDVWRIEPGTDD
jgi:hypothetical protein